MFMRINGRKTAAVLMLASYLLVSLFAHAFHHHGPSGCSGCAQEHPTPPGHAAACCLHDHGTVCHDVSEETPAAFQAVWSFSAEDCQICQYLAQKWGTADLPEAARLAETVWLLVPRRPSFLPAPLLLAWHIRGPPAVA